MTKRLAVLILLLIFCAAFLIRCTAPSHPTVPPDCGEATAPQIQPRESIPAQPGEGPAGLPTPAL